MMDADKAFRQLKKQERALGALEKEKGDDSPKVLRARAKDFIKEAEEYGVHFIVKYDKCTDIYTVSVRGEEGQVRCTLRRLPALLHGLRLMGSKVREMFFSWQR